MKVDAKSFGLGVVVGGMVMFLVCAALLLAVAWGMNKRDEAKRLGTAPAFCPVAGDKAVTDALAPIRKKYNVPAMAALLLTSDGVKLAGAVGVRKRGTEIPVELNDRWHLGSDGKAMTSTLIALLVERGQLKWDTTLGEIFPELAPQMSEGFRNVTVTQLLSHRAGLPENVKLRSFQGSDGPGLRLRVVREELAKKPLSEGGEKFRYSNVGFMIAGAIVEKITGQPWEREIASEVFQPLGMASAGFGGTGTPGKIDQPWPHTKDGEPTAENGPDMDNPPVMGPAGRIHCTIQDWAKFAQDQLRGARGEPGLLKPESYKKIQTPAYGDYAFGWSVAERSWGGGTVLNHVGDNTMNCADVWIAPKKNFAVLVCVNESGDTAFEAADAAAVAMIHKAER